jgi:hypothetical protein
MLDTNRAPNGAEHAILAQRVPVVRDAQARRI